MSDEMKGGRKALVIIDYQNGVLVDPLPLNAMAILDRIRLLAEDARRLGHSVVYVQHEEKGRPSSTEPKAGNSPPPSRRNRTILSSLNGLATLSGKPTWRPS